ncbi:MAG: phenylacetate-CoA oxygenase subunit PaaC [Flavobacteriales bacterium]|nr:phenylacetate-CoA oxygenase subunit PaaC [Flavobacteriales bacterium]
MKNLYQYILLLGDNSLVLGHRLSELCGHGPSLETDIALTNMSLDLYGQVRSYFQYAAELGGEKQSEDHVAFLRSDREYKCVQLVEQPNTDFAHVILRQFLFDVYHLELMKQLVKSKDERIAAIAAKAIKEVSYHERFSSEWVRRLGAGTDESNSRMKVALEHLYPFVAELFNEHEIEKEMKEAGIGADLKEIEKTYYATIKRVLAEAELSIPEVKPRRIDGKHGFHSEHLGHILSELQYMQRAYPNLQW